MCIAAQADNLFFHASQIPKIYQFVDILIFRSLRACISKFTKGMILVIPLSVAVEHLFVDLLLYKGQAPAILLMSSVFEITKNTGY